MIKKDFIPGVIITKSRHETLMRGSHKTRDIAVVLSVNKDYATILNHTNISFRIDVISTNYLFSFWEML